MLLTMSVANATPFIRDRQTAPGRSVESLERNIAETRMAAAIGADWEQIHLRSREIAGRIDRHESPARQIDEARQVRTELHQAGDTLGLRALRLAAAGPMIGWQREGRTGEAARALARLFAADQCLGIPGLADMEAELEQARASQEIGSPEL